MKKILTILALMVATVTAYGADPTYLKKDYAPSGQKFVVTTDIDWETQKIAASIDISKCSGTSENILSVGNVISNWSSNEDSSIKAVVHIYYTQSTRLVRVYYIETNNNRSCNDLTLDSDVNELKIEVSKEGGITVNGTNLCSGLTSSSDLWNYTSAFQIGSQEGSTRSNATYNYIVTMNASDTAPVVVPSTTPTITVGTVPGTTALGSNADGYDADGKTFTNDVNIDWSTQKLVASIDVSTCESSVTNENLLSVGTNIGEWTTSTGGIVHLYYTRSSKAVTLWYNESTQNGLASAKTVSGDELIVEISKDKGITINGTDFNNSNTISTFYAKFFALTSISVGSTQGANRSNATYNYIRIMDINENNDITLAETTSDTDYATLATTYKDKTQSSLTLTRTLKADAWNTFCVPFNITDITAFGAVKEFSSVNGSTMIFKDATTIEAGKPYLVKPAGSNIKNPKFVYATITSDTPETNVSNNSTYNFVGVYGQHTFTSDDASNSYILVSGGSLVNPTANTTMNGMRAYFTYTKTGSVAPRVLIDGVETALTEVVGGEEVNDGRIYNLRGMYVGNDESRLAKGIYIKNGKKVVLN